MKNWEPGFNGRAPALAMLDFAARGVRWPLIAVFFKGLALGWAGLLLGCATPPKAPPAAKTIPVRLISNGFHVGLILPTAAAPEILRRQPEARGSRYLLVGWGNRHFYTGGEATVSAFLRAALLPDQSAVHVVGLRGPIAQQFPRSDVVRFDLSPRQVAALRDYVERVFERQPNGELRPIKPGFFPNSRFYEARPLFFFPHFCTTWSGQALRQAGVPLFLPSALTAENLRCQALRFGVEEQRKRHPADGF